MADERRNALNWFEIPSNDFERAKKFYETIIGSPMFTMKMGDVDMAFFPMDEGEVGGAVIFHKDAKPSSVGTMVYLNANPDLSAILSRVEKAGGKIALPKTVVTPELGFMAVFFDSEGNRVALHSRN